MESLPENIKSLVMRAKAFVKEANELWLSANHLNGELIHVTRPKHVLMKLDARERKYSDCIENLKKFQITCRVIFSTTTDYNDIFILTRKKTYVEICLDISILETNFESILKVFRSHEKIATKATKVRNKCREASELYIKSMMLMDAFFERNIKHMILDIVDSSVSIAEERESSRSNLKHMLCDTVDIAVTIAEERKSASGWGSISTIRTLNHC